MINSIYIISPIKLLDQISTPILFIHGDSDNFVPAFMVQAMYERKKEIKSLYLSKGSEHATAFNDNPEEYRRQVSIFISTFLPNE